MSQLQQIADLREEADELHRLLADLPDREWDRPTQFKAWTTNDILQHLHMGDAMGLASATDPAGGCSPIGARTCRACATRSRPRARTSG